MKDKLIPMPVCTGRDPEQDPSAYDLAEYSTGHALVRSTTYDNGDYEAFCLNCHIHVIRAVDIPLGMAYDIWE